MDQEHLLNNIMFYSDFITDPENINRKIYIKPHFNPIKMFTATTSAVIKPVQNISNKVLINPNFKHPNVHINPHFNAAISSKRKILLNPKMLNNQMMNIEPLKINPIEKETEFVVPKNINNVSQNFTTPPRKRRLSIRSQYKIVRSSVVNQDNSSKFVTTKSTYYSNIVRTPSNVVKSFSPNLTIRKRRVSIRSKYKIVTNSSSNQLKSTLITPRKSINSKYKIVKNSSTVKNKYKIDRRSINIRIKSLNKKKVITNGFSDILRKNLFKNNKNYWKNKLNSPYKSINNNLANISGILYKKSHNKLQKVQTNLKLKKNLNVKRYSSVNRQSLFVSSPNKILINSLSKMKTSNNLYNKSGNGSTSSLERKSKQRYKFQKNNMPCPVYRRYGKCRRKDAGRCIFLHNPNQIFLCKKFLQGECVDKNCLLSHKISSEKMPTCRFFLEGCCNKTDCPYVHVQINPNADICRKFLEGFCHEGSQCKLRHQFLCPDFERDRKCSKRKCLFPHKIKKPDQDNTIVEKSAEIKPAERYYLETKVEDNIEKGDEQVKYSPNNKINDDLSSHDIVYKRPQLGTLPSFIPF